MAQKQCPVCGKKVAPQAQYCIYCSAKFDNLPEHTKVISIPSDLPEEPKETKEIRSGGKLGLIVTMLSLLLIVAVLCLVFFGPEELYMSTKETTTTAAPTTTTTRNAARDEWLQTFTGYWYDEASIGKGNLKQQGGYVLYIHEIFRDTVTFDLLSYQGGDAGKIASAADLKAVLNDDTLHFTYDNDSLGHKGEGFLRLTHDGIQMEVMADGKTALSDGEHSLAVCSVFKRKALPHSAGHDLLNLTTMDMVKSVAGKQTADPVTDAAGNITYTYGALKAITDKDGVLTRLIMDYSADTDKSRYCFECVDGTMDYLTVKTYFGEALHDYVEQPTDIRVLHYIRSDTSVTFTFDADNNLLILVDYLL